MLVFVFLVSSSLAGRWIFLGGYTGLENSRGGGRASSFVETLTLTDPQSFHEKYVWCSGNFSRAPMDLEGATISRVSGIAYARRRVGDPTYDSGHHTTQVESWLVCGGADDQYLVKNSCLWWNPLQDSWSLGPSMRSPRYQAASVSLPSRGLVWMLGGRRGSTILQDTEVLVYPQSRRSTGGLTPWSAKRWDWAHRKQKNIEVWNNGVPGDADQGNPGMKLLPMPLSGHCVVEVGAGQSRGILVIGGGTTKVNEDGTFLTNSGPLPSSHLHLYHLAGPDKDKWSSSFPSPLVLGTRPLARLVTSRMNHGCLALGNSVYVAGGVTVHPDGQRFVLNSMERYDLASNTWTGEADLPFRLTGIKMISVAGAPTMVGRYGTQRTAALLRYSEDKEWERLPRSLLVGRGDFLVVDDLPATVSLYPDMQSQETRLSQGGGGDRNWRNTFGRVTAGRRGVWKTGRGQRPWIQLDLGSEISIKKVQLLSNYIMLFIQVHFETGHCTLCDGSDDTGQPVEVRRRRRTQIFLKCPGSRRKHSRTFRNGFWTRPFTGQTVYPGDGWDPGSGLHIVQWGCG